VTAWIKETCPVCKRSIGVSPTTATIRPHTDKAGNPCPMSGIQVA
jgi:hypothetical protein